MALHFTEHELARRRRRACDAMAGRGLDGMLLFRQESMYYLTGYDTFGYVFFQCLYMGGDGTMTLGQTVAVTEGGCEPLTRAPTEFIVK